MFGAIEWYSIVHSPIAPIKWRVSTLIFFFSRFFAPARSHSLLLLYIIDIFISFAFLARDFIVMRM